MGIRERERRIQKGDINERGHRGEGNMKRKIQRGDIRKRKSDTKYTEEGEIWKEDKHEKKIM